MPRSLTTFSLLARGEMCPFFSTRSRLASLSLLEPIVRVLLNTS